MKMVDRKRAEYTAQLSNKVGAYKLAITFSIYKERSSLTSYIRIWDLYDVIVFDKTGESIHEWTKELKDEAN
jgi:hypothetical protein